MAELNDDLDRLLDEATESGALDLSGRDLTDIPTHVFDLTDLHQLQLNGNRLTGLPPEIGRLTKLRVLWLQNNEVAALPAEIGELAELVDLWLDDNQLTELPPEVGRLSSLTELRAAGNPLTTLPPEIGRLGSLTTLMLDANRLASLPAEIGDLAALRVLSLSNNELTGLPAEIGNLTGLEILALDDNRLAELPPTIGRLTSLRELRLDDNRLTRLPRQLAGPLRNEILSLSADGNPLMDPLPLLVARGSAQVASYLEDLDEEVALYEAKVLLVGEGNVGKSSLLAALRDEEFDPRRNPTHALDVRDIRTADAGARWDTGGDRPNLTLRFWDFGGQAEYRVSHQFFYSARAIFLLVWHPREGAQSGDLTGWLRRIRARCGEHTHVLLVATHGDERQAYAFDPAGLPTELATMIRGSYRVDNASGHGIDDLARAVVGLALDLDHLGTTLPDEWAAVRTEVMDRARNVPILERDEFTAICDRRGVRDPDAQETLATLMHDLGQVVYHGHIEGLRGLMVLDPEWLAKAIGAILVDRPTQEARGVLDHSRLREIWSTSGYPAEYHAYLLRLMEEFDISWRLEGGRQSLIAPLVPTERPATLAWTAESPTEPGERRLRLQCTLRTNGPGGPVAPAPGLISALTVRHHHATTGRHWRSGVFLAHPSPHIGSTALIELVPLAGAGPASDDVAAQLMIEVRGADPAFFLHVLAESIDALRRERWPGLSLDLQVPCLGNLSDGTPCPNLFPLDDLRSLPDERSAVLCLKCRTDQVIAALLTGYAGVVDATPASRQLAELIEIVGETKIEVQGARKDIEGLRVELATAAKRVYRVLLTVNSIVSDVPRLFTIAARSRPSDRVHLLQDSYQLMLWCEHQGSYHPVPEATYVARRPKRWLGTARPYIRLVLHGLQPFLPFLAAAAGELLTTEEAEVVHRHIDMITAMGDLVGDGPDDGLATSEPVHGPQRAPSTALHAYRTLLLELAPTRVFPGLQALPAPSGEIVWVCHRHTSFYQSDEIHLP